jgi:hypothetical protein
MTRGLIIAVLGMLALAANARAQQQQQSVYTRNTLNNIYQNNSVRNYSSRQIFNSVLNRSVPQYSFSNVNRGLFSQTLNNSPLGGKPFKNAGDNSSVSPWLALSSPFSSTANNYYTQVRPQLDQQRINQQQAARNEQLRRQLTSMAAQGPYNVTGNENMAPTGHAAAYMNYGGYYTPVQPTKQR